MNTQPTFYIPHGGGPCFFMEWPQNPTLWDNMADMLRSLPQRLPQKPAAILVVTAHWEAPVFTFCGGANPQLEYDYYGFPPHTYELTYKAKGAPELAQHAAQLLQNVGIAAHVDEQAPWDHGVFIPLKVSWPNEDVPVLAMSLKRGLDPQEHLAAGKALRQLRDENVVIIGSGLSYHNLRTFFAEQSQLDNLAAAEFDKWLVSSSANDETTRHQALSAWESAPYARQVHPREEHLLPLMVVAGAGAEHTGSAFYQERIMNKAVSAIGFGL